MLNREEYYLYFDHRSPQSFLYSAQENGGGGEGLGRLNQRVHLNKCDKLIYTLNMIFNYLYYTYVLIINNNNNNNNNGIDEDESA